jgi:hypothetical protein
MKAAAAEAAGAEHAAVEAPAAETAAVEPPAETATVEPAAPKPAAPKPATVTASTSAATVTTATATSAATAARQRGAWLGHCENRRERGDGNTRTACEADAFHADLLPSRRRSGGYEGAIWGSILAGVLARG